MIKPVIYQRVTWNQVHDEYDDFKTNLLLKAAFEKYDWKAFKDQYGYRVEDDTMYICVDPAYTVMVNGQEYDADEALDKFSIEQLEDYITDGDSTTIRRYLSVYELSDEIDYDQIAYDLLGEDYSLRDIIDAVEDAEIDL